MAGFINDTSGRELMFCDNVDFTGNAKPSAQMVLDGQLLIGSSVSPQITAATLTAGSGISIVNGHGSITISNSAASMFAWTDEGSSFNAVANNGYMSTAAITATLPLTPSNGTTIAFLASNSSLFKIAPNTGDKIRLGNALSTNGSGGGYIQSTLPGDSVELVYQTSSAIWQAVIGAIGNWTVN